MRSAPYTTTIKGISSQNNRSTGSRIVIIALMNLGILSLMLSVFTVIDMNFGMVAVSTSIPLADIIGDSDSYEDVPLQTLIDGFTTYGGERIVRREEAQEPLTERSKSELWELIQIWVLKPRVVSSWSLSETILYQDQLAQYQRDNPEHILSFRSWLTPSFLVSSPSNDAGSTGARVAILGTLWVTLIALAFAVPIGFLCAGYLNEFAPANGFTTFIRLTIQNLAAVPSIIFGLLGLVFFVRFLEPITSGSLFGISDPGSNGRTILSGGLTLGLMILPTIVINTQAALTSVPSDYRQAAMAVGARKHQIVLKRLFPAVRGRLLTIVIVSISRVLGELSPMIIVGAATFITADPNTVFSQFTTLSVQVFYWSSEPSEQYKHLAAAGILLLVVMSLVLNGLVQYIRGSWAKKDKS